MAFVISLSGTFLISDLVIIAQCQSNSYYISANHFDFSNAEFFCRHRCQSHLASIHSDDDYNRSLAIIQSSYPLYKHNVHKDVWIGLQDINREGRYVYNDGSDFDYATDTSGGVYPWKIGSPNNANPNNGIGAQDCVQYSFYFDYKLDDTECTSVAIIFCAINATKSTNIPSSNN